MGKIIKDEKQLKRLFEENKIEIFSVEDEIKIDIRLENENELLRLLENKNEKRVYFYQEKFLKDKNSTITKSVEKYALSNKEVSSYFKELKEREKNSDKVKYTLVFTIDNGKYIGIKVDNPNFDHELEEEINRFYYNISVVLLSNPKSKIERLKKTHPHPFLIGDK